MKTNPELIPAFATLSAASDQVTDQFGGTFSATIPGRATEMPGIAAQSQAADSWGLTPVTDPKSLRQLRDLFLVEMNPENPDVRKNFEKDFAPQPNVGTSGTLIPAVKIPKRPEENGFYVFTQPQKPATTQADEGDGTKVPSNVVYYKPTIALKDALCSARCVVISDEPPTDNAIDGGSHLSRHVWITDANKFFDFEVLVLQAASATTTATTGGPSPSSSVPNKLQLQFFGVPGGAVNSIR
jgi:hypothetical protein